MSCYKSELGCTFGDKCSFAHRQVEGQPSEKPEKDGDKIAVAITKDARQLVCVFQDTEPLESLPILWKSPKVWDQFNECDAQKLRSVMQTSEKTKVRRSGKFKTKFLISAVRTL